MITSLAQIITGCLIKNKIIDNTKLDIYIYGFEIMISNIICFGIGLLIGTVFSEFAECIVFLSVFVMLRRYCGGYHAETYLKCDTIFTINILLVMTILKVISFYPIYIHFIIDCISIVSVFMLAPVENKYKPLTEDAKKKHKLWATIISLIIITISSVLCFINIKFAAVIDMALITVALSMIIEFLRKGVYVHNEKRKKSNS